MILQYRLILASFVMENFLPFSICISLSPFGCVLIRLNLRWCTAACERAELCPPHQTHLQSSSLLAWVDQACLTGLRVTAPVEHGRTRLSFVSPHNLNIFTWPFTLALQTSVEFYKCIPPAFYALIISVSDGRNVKHKRQYHLDLREWFSSGSQKNG